MVTAFIWGREDTSVQDESCIRATGVCLLSQYQSWMFKMTPPSFRFEIGKSHSQVAIQFLEACKFLSHYAPTKAYGLFFFFFSLFNTANDEVIVYFPTGGFLGDGNLSAKLWRKPQFLPAEWKVEAKVWIHVGNGVMCPNLCVFHKSQMCIFLTHTRFKRLCGVCHFDFASLFYYFKPLLHTF